MTESLITRDYYLILLLMLGIFVTSVGLIASSHKCREHYSFLQKLEVEAWLLKEEHSQLLLEHSTWASYDRVEEVATRKLFMRAPDIPNTVLIYK